MGRWKKDNLRKVGRTDARTHEHSGAFILGQTKTRANTMLLFKLIFTGPPLTFHQVRHSIRSRP